jgi:hypothetical protein
VSQTNTVINSPQISVEFNTFYNRNSFLETKTDEKV